MTPNSDWWDRAKLPPRPQPIEIRKRGRRADLHGQRPLAAHARVQAARSATECGCGGNGHEIRSGWLASLTVEPPLRVHWIDDRQGDSMSERIP